MNPNNPNSKNAKMFVCEMCNFISSKESNYNTHLMTLKHERLINPNKIMPTIINNYHGCICGKTYKHTSSLCAHKKICTKSLQVLSSGTNLSNTSTKPPDVAFENKNNVIEFLIKENSEFKNIILDVVKSNSELQKQMLDICKNNNTTHNNLNYNNSHNKTFNLQFFLNEQCKDAMNISDFANSFDLQLSDLESVGELGYVEGITKLMLDKLCAMDIYKRPIHCSDAKREILYVKDEDKWEKEQRNNPKLRHAIKTVSFKNMKLAPLWSDTYPDSKSSESILNDVYMKIIIESTGGSGEIGDSENKIIKRIAKEFFIDKNSICL